MSDNFETIQQMLERFKLKRDQIQYQIDQKKEEIKFYEKLKEEKRCSAFTTPTDFMKMNDELQTLIISHANTNKYITSIQNGKRPIIKSLVMLNEKYGFESGKFNP